MEEFQDFAILDYRINMRLDNLPVAEMNFFAFEDKPKVKKKEGRKKKEEKKRKKKENCLPS